MDIIDLIEKCDLSARNLQLREETCKTIILGLSEITLETESVKVSKKHIEQ